MATKKPLVMGSNGLPQQLQSGDELAANIASTQVRTRTNANAGSLVKGAPVYKNSTSDEVDKARANAAGTARVYGLVYDTTIATTAQGTIATDGPLIATTTEWDAVTGQTGGLTPGAMYFLDPATAGKLTTTPPTTAGQLVVKVGEAVSDVELEINISDPILL
jgi:hypothetical protein